MALGKPFINTFKPFDANTEKVIPFVYSGENFTKRTYKITYQNGNWLYNTEQASTFIVQNKEFSITLPQNTCSNGNGFIIYVRVGNNNNEWSEWSNGCYFWCYSEGSLSFNDNTLNSAELHPALYLASNSYEFQGQYNFTPNVCDDWYSCQYLLKQYDNVTGSMKIVGNSGILYNNTNANLPSFVFDKFSQTSGTVYTIVLSCTTKHGVVLSCEKNFTVSYEQPSISVNANITNIKDDNNEFTGKIQIDLTASRLRADNADDTTSFSFIQDTNDVTNYFVDLTDDSREITFTQGCELMNEDWNILIHVKNFKGLQRISTNSFFTGLPIGEKIEKNPFFTVISKKNGLTIATLKCYYDNAAVYLDNENKYCGKFYLEYNNDYIDNLYESNETFDNLQTTVLNGNTVYTDLMSILIKKINNNLFISVVKV